MLAPPDEEIARRDPALPGMRVALDPEATADRLGAVLGPSIHVVPSYVRYKPGASCLVAYRVTAGGEERFAYVKAFAGGETGKLAKMTSSEWAAAFERDMVGVAVFPHDRWLPVIGRLREPDFRQALVATLFPELSHAEGRLCMLRYKPERRYVARLELGGRTVAVLKAYCPDDYRRAAKASKTPFGEGSVRTAARLAAYDRHRLMVLEWLPGRPVDPSSGREAEEAGAALARLHRRSGKHLHRRHRREEAADLVVVGDYLARLLPQIADLARATASILAQVIRATERRKRPVHGDFSVDQVVVGATGVGILDLDNAVVADPAADLGWFAADLEMRALESLVTPDQAAECVNRLLGGYRANGGADVVERLPLHLASSLLHRAAEPFRLRWDNWPEHVESIVRRAEELSVQ